MSPPGGFNKRPVGAVSMYGSSATSMVTRNTIAKGVPMGGFVPPVPAKKGLKRNLFLMYSFCRYDIAKVLSAYYRGTNEFDSRRKEVYSSFDSKSNYEMERSRIWT